MAECIGSPGSPQYCNTNPKSNTKLGIPIYGQGIQPGTAFTISIPIISNAWLIGDCVAINIYDKDDQGTPIYKSGMIYIPAGLIVTYEVSLLMPSKNWNLRINLMNENTIITRGCEDYKDITVMKYDPVLTYHNECGADGICRQVQGSGINQCSDIGSTTGCMAPPQPCGSGTTNILGYCVPGKYIMYGGVGILLYLILRGGVTIQK